MEIGILIGVWAVNFLIWNMVVDIEIDDRTWTLIEFYLIKDFELHFFFVNGDECISRLWIVSHVID